MRAALAAIAVVAGALVAPPAGPAVPASPGSDPGLTVTGPASGRCPTGFACSAFTVACPAPWDGVAPLTGRLAVGEARGTPRGTVLLFGGGSGMDYWGTTSERRAFVKSLRRDGLRTVEVAWDGPWAVGTVGFAGLSCRPAAVVAWGAAEHAASGAVAPAGDGVCGFCLVGLSIGASQVTHPLTTHGQAPVVDAVVAMAGPATADVAAGCRRDGSALQYLEAERSPVRVRVDDAWDGGDPAAGPCEALPSDPSWEPTWQADGVATAGAHAFPATRFHFVWGARDTTGAAGQGMAFLAALAADGGTPMLDYDCVSAPHDVAATVDGLAAVRSALLWGPEDGFANVPPVPAPTVDPRCVVTAP